MAAFLPALPLVEGGQSVVSLAGIEVTLWLCVANYRQLFHLGEADVHDERKSPFAVFLLDSE